MSLSSYPFPKRFGGHLTLDVGRFKLWCVEFCCFCRASCRGRLTREGQPRGSARVRRISTPFRPGCGFLNRVWNPSWTSASAPDAAPSISVARLTCQCRLKAMHTGKTRASQASSSEKVMHLKQELATTTELVNDLQRLTTDPTFLPYRTGIAPTFRRDAIIVSPTPLPQTLSHWQAMAAQQHQRQLSQQQYY
jgi:hypothetical protein